MNAFNLELAMMRDSFGGGGGVVYVSLNIKAEFFYDLDFKKLELEENIKYHKTEHKNW